VRAKDPAETWEEWLDAEVRDLAHLCRDAPPEMAFALAETVMGRLQRDEHEMRDLETFLISRPWATEDRMNRYLGHIEQWGTPILPWRVFSVFVNMLRYDREAAMERGYTEVPTEASIVTFESVFRELFRDKQLPATPPG
jgi:hypothetical protein